MGIVMMTNPVAVIISVLSIKMPMTAQTQMAHLLTSMETGSGSMLKAGS
jgi:hypothetical protein